MGRNREMYESHEDRVLSASIPVACNDRSRRKESSVKSARFLHAALVTKEQATIQQAQGFWVDVG